VRVIGHWVYARRARHLLCAKRTTNQCNFPIRNVAHISRALPTGNCAFHWPTQTNLVPNENLL